MEPDDRGTARLYIARRIQGRGSQNRAEGSTDWGERKKRTRERPGARDRRWSFLAEGALGKVNLWDRDLV